MKCESSRWFHVANLSRAEAEHHLDPAMGTDGRLQVAQGLALRCKDFESGRLENLQNFVLTVIPGFLCMRERQGAGIDPDAALLQYLIHAW